MKAVLRLLVIVALGLPAFADSITLYGSHAGGLQVSGATATRMWQHSTGDPAWSAFAGGAVLSSRGASAFTVTRWAGISSNNVINNGSPLSVGPAQRLKLISGTNNNGRLYSNGHGRGNENIRTAVPEPETLGLLGTGLFFIGGLVRRKMKTRELLHSSHDLQV